jgi:hypothetical protein
VQSARTEKLLTQTILFYHRDPAKVSRIHPKGMSAVDSAVVRIETQQYRFDHHSGAGAKSYGFSG